MVILTNGKKPRQTVFSFMFAESLQPTVSTIEYFSAANNLLNLLIASLPRCKVPSSRIAVLSIPTSSESDSNVPLEGIHWIVQVYSNQAKAKVKVMSLSWSLMDQLERKSLSLSLGVNGPLQYDISHRNRYFAWLCSWLRRYQTYDKTRRHRFNDVWPNFLGADVIRT